MRDSETRLWFLALCVLLVSALPVFSQSSPAVDPSSSDIAAMDQSLQTSQTQSPFFGGVATSQPVSGVLPLSLTDAVNRGLKQNLGVLLSTDTVSAARGRRWQMLSALLPNVTTETSFSAKQLDLKAEIGLQIPNVPPVIGPFGVFDTRVYLKQSIFDWNSIERVRSSSELLKEAGYSYRNARELVVLAVSSSYLLAIADKARVDSATAQRDTAEALYRQTADQNKAGVAAAIDVLRSDVELQAREQELIVARNGLAKQKLVLARAIGLPSGQLFRLTTDVAYHALQTINLDDALKRAYSSRPDYRSAIAEERSAELERKAVAAERYPSLSVEANYGDIGLNPGNSHGTVGAAAVLTIPIFQGGRVHGDALQAAAGLRQARERLEDLRSLINQEVRDAYLDLQAAGDEVAVEKNAVHLATETLQQSRDRFASGVTDNIEVVQAQESLADANDAYITSLYRYNVAKISLARAVGVAESNFALYLKGK